MSRIQQWIATQRRHVLSLFATLSLLAGLTINVMAAAPALAATTQCSGFTACETAPYTDHGWGQNYPKSYWGQYSGHNCTNYVAYYEQAVNGMPATRPAWLGSGNADAWASEAAAGGVTVSSTPVVGAVAQWGDYGWNGSNGHVGIVESVVTNGTATTIVVSWDSYPGGPYQWVSLSSTSPNTSSSVGWPNSFIYAGGVGTASSGGTNTTPRIITLDSAGNLSVKEGALNTGWVLVLTGVVDYDASPNRIAALDASGNLFVKDGPIGATWVQVATGVSPGNFHVTNDMIAVLWGTDLYTKVGSIYGTWGLTLNPVQSFQVSAGDHIAAYMTNGHVLVQWGSVGSGWTDVATGTSGYAITNDMVAAAFGTDFFVKDGAVGAGWWLIMNPVSTFAVSPSDHVAALMTNGTLNVMWGPPGSTWTGVASGLDAYAITDNRVGILQGGTLSIKEGAVNAVWTQVATGMVSFKLT